MLKSLQKSKMKKLLTYIFFTIISTCTINSQRHVVYIPNDKLTKIKIDGKTHDWDWVPQNYFITGKEMNNNYLISKATYNKKNWDCKIFIAWSDVTNRIYIVATIYDDIKTSNSKSIIPNPNQFDDNLHVIVNPDNYSGDCWNKLTYNDIHRLLKISMNTPFSKGNDQFVIDYGPSWLTNHKELIHCERTNKYNSTTGPCETIYEIEIALWDEWSDLGIEYSSRHVLSSDNSIRLAIVIDDVDKTKNQIDDEWMTCIQPLWSKIIVQMPDYILDPGCEPKNSWPGIKNFLMQKY